VPARGKPSELSVADPRLQRLGRLAEQCLAVQACIDEQRAEAQLLEALQHARQQCEAAAAHAVGAGEQELLGRLTTVVGTWQQVWPRLGAQRDFRSAVAREARLWAQRLAESAPHA